MTTRALALVALLLGLGASIAGNPYSSPHFGRADQISALTLAVWIRDRHPGLRVIDVRPVQDFNAFQIPTAERARPPEQLGLSPDDIVVVYGDSTEAALDTWRSLRAREHRAIVLTGGIASWLDDVMNPISSTELTRYFGGVARDPSSYRPGSQATGDRVKQIRRRGC